MLQDLIQNLPRYHNQILGIALRNKDAYFNSECYRLLKKRHEILTDSYNLRFTGRTASKSKVAFPIVLEKSLMRRAILKSSLRGDPLVNVEPIGDTPKENANNAERVLNNNFKTTRFRDRFLNGGQGINFLSKYGSLVCYNYMDVSHKKERRLENTQYGAQMVESPIERRTVKARFIHNLNYFQDATCPDMRDSPFAGHLQCWQPADLVNLAINSNVYDKEALAKLINQAGKKRVKDSRFYTPLKDDAESGLDVTHMWLNLSELPGNEDDDTLYYLEILNDVIIRFQDDPYYSGSVKYCGFHIDKRPDFWWGNTDAEYIMSHEGAYNLLMNMKLDNLQNEMLRYIFVRRGMGIDTAAINDRWKNNGFVFHDSERPVDEIIKTWAPGETASNGFNQAMQELNSSIQKMSTKYDYLGGGNNPSLPNKTAYAASVIEGQSDIEESDIMEQCSQGITDIGQDQMVKLQQLMPEQFQVRVDEKTPPINMARKDIAGAFAYSFSSSAQKSKVFAQQQFLQATQTLIGLMASGIPAFQKINFEPIVKELVRKFDLGDMHEIYLDQPATQPGGFPALPGPAAGLSAAPVNLEALANVA